MNRHDQFDVLMCALDEKRTVKQTVTELNRISLVKGVRLVDDGSTDETAELAESAGAQVTRLSKNYGKAQAMRIGLTEITTPLVLLWDADLRGTNANHLQLMMDRYLKLKSLNPDKPAMVVGVLNLFGQKMMPNLSGQRLLETDALRDFFEGHPDLARFGIEVELTEWAREHDWSTNSPTLFKIKHLGKERKRGIIRGFFIHRIPMYWQMLVRK